MKRQVEFIAASVFVSLLLIASGCASAASQSTADLVIHDAAVFDTRAKQIRPHRTVVVRDSFIAAVVPAGSSRVPKAERTIDAGGRLLTPGFIDVHHHTANVLAGSDATDGAVADLSMRPDSIAAYRHAFAEAYLPYGVTVVREAGGDDRYLPLMKAWMEPVPWAPDFYPSGGALISPPEDGEESFAGHTVVEDSTDAAQTIQRYQEAGVEHVKLYWKLRLAEFKAALREAKRLGMVPYGHIEYGEVSISKALELGLRHFEHAHTLAAEALPEDKVGEVWDRASELLNGDRSALFHMGVLETFNELGRGNPRMTSLIEDLADAGATVTPTVHVFAHPLGLTHFERTTSDDFSDTSGWSEEQMARARRGYEVLESYVRRLHESGVALSLGTDMPQPGRAALSELLLLHRTGIPMADMLRIATLNSARALGLEEQYGTVEPGKHAHFVLFDENPLENPNALLSGKTVIKGGVVYTAKGQDKENS